MTDYTTVSETWGLAASPEQLSMQYFRYRMAADLSVGRDVLEIGCGSGMGLSYLGERARKVVGGTPRLRHRSPSPRRRGEGWGEGRALAVR